MFRNIFRRPARLSHSASKAFTPLFVAGVPRSGTTILHAIVCASRRTNGFINECSYFTALIHPMLVGLQAFDVHTKDYFESREALVDSHAEILRGILRRIWQQTGRRQILALKDPMMTHLIPHVARALPEARFIVSVRDPRAVISSRVEVIRREAPGKPVTDEQLRTLCAEFRNMYGAILGALPELGDRILLVDYRDVVTGQAFDKLAGFGLGEIDPQKIWTDPVTSLATSPDDPWVTALHREKPTAASLHRYREILDTRAEQIIMDGCGDVARSIGAV